MSCCICISTIKYNSDIIQCQQCLQIYHHKCYMKWYKYNNNINQCPHCNYISNNKIIITQYIPHQESEDTDNSLYSSLTNLDDSITESSSDDDNQIIPIIDNNIYIIDRLYPDRNYDIKCCSIVTFLFFIFGAIFILYFDSIERNREHL